MNSLHEHTSYLNSVFVVLTEINGYRNIATIFATRDDAEKYANDLRNSFKWERHDVYVCEYNVCKYI